MKVEVLPSSEIELFKGQVPFTIIRIFTKTENNQYLMRLQEERPSAAVDSCTIILGFIAELADSCNTKSV